VSVGGREREKERSSFYQSCSALSVLDKFCIAAAAAAAVRYVPCCKGFCLLSLRRSCFIRKASSSINPIDLAQTKAIQNLNFKLYYCDEIMICKGLMMAGNLFSLCMSYLGS